MIGYLYLFFRTPIQNNLLELWALLNLVTFKRFNDKTEFKSHFENPIKKSMKRSAHADAIDLGEKRQAELQHIVSIHMLQRKKDDVLADSLVKGKEEFKVFCEMTPMQGNMNEIYYCYVCNILFFRNTI